MTEHSEQGLSDAERRLARQLLDSARLDEVPSAAAAAAWTKFSSGFAALALEAAPPGAAQSGAALRGIKRVAADSGLAVRWLLVGAIAGSAITALWLAPSRAPDGGGSNDTAPAASVVSAPVAPSTAAAVATAETHEAPPQLDVRPSVAPKRARSRVVERATLPRSTLAAEVAQLDAARTALEIGALGEARRLLAEFQKEFPRGELTIEAQVMRLEVLGADADRAALQSEGARFLEQHGNGPHAERVRQLIETTQKP